MKHIATKDSMLAKKANDERISATVRGSGQRKHL